jgi:hypothetical protein
MIDFGQPAFVERAHAWSREAVASAGARIVGDIEQIHLRPWSTVFRVPTDAGPLFVKCCGPTQRHEPRLTALLDRTHPGLVPRALAVHPTEPWMLVADGGRRVDEVHDGGALLEAWRRLLPRYVELERAMAPKVPDALAIGTPDHRAPALVAGLRVAIDEEPALSRARDDRLSETERAALGEVVPLVENACAELASLGIPDTVQHDDLHQGNLLVREGRAVVFDWGDACVSHPFLTLAVTLRFAAARAGVAPDSAELAAVRDAYLSGWSDLAAAADLRAAAEVARRLGEVSRTLTWRVVASTYPGVVDQYPGGFAGSLRRILRLFS